MKTCIVGALALSPKKVIIGWHFSLRLDVMHVMSGIIGATRDTYNRIYCATNFEDTASDPRARLFCSHPHVCDEWILLAKR